jgi:hypothetical protein
MKTLESKNQNNSHPFIIFFIIMLLFRIEYSFNYKKELINNIPNYIK